MRVLFLSSVFYADSDFPWVRAMQERGVEVTYLLHLPPYALRATLFDFARQPQPGGLLPASSCPELRRWQGYLDLAHVYLVNQTSPHDLSPSTLRLVWRVVQLWRRGGYDVFHTSLYARSMLLPVALCRPGVLTVHDPVAHTGDASLAATLWRWAAVRLTRGCVVFNEAQRGPFARRYGLLDRRVLRSSLLPFDCLPRLSDAQPAPSAEAGPAGRRLLFFGRMAPYKGLSVLCEAMGRVREAVPDVVLTVAGGGPMDFDPMATAAGPSLRLIHRYVPIGELAALLRSADLVVCPYTDATQSGVVMTSFAMGCPVVVTRVGGLADMVAEGATGLVVEPRRPDLLAEALVALLTDPALLDAMRRCVAAAWRQALDERPALIGRYLDFYRQLGA